MTKDEYEDFVLRYKGCGACFPMYHTLSRFEKMWFSAIQKDVAELEKENAELKGRIQTLEQIKKEHTDYTIKVEEERTSVKEQLTNAKELLKQWLQTSKASSCDNINIVTEAEQFLKESE